MRMQFANLFLLASAVAVQGQTVSPPTTAVQPLTPIPTDGERFTGVHETVMTPVHDGAPAVAFCPPSGGENRYIDMRFLALKTTSAGQKEPLILFRTRAQGSFVDLENDLYRTGVVNTTDSPGIHLLVGQWTSPDTAYEFGATYIDPFFYKRIQEARTVQGGTFGQASISTVTFLPTGTPLDFSYVYYKVYHWGLESNMRRRVVQDECRWLDAIVGLRYHQIHERYNIDVTPVDGAGGQESYHTGNDVFGVQLGVESDRKIAEYVSIRGVAKYVLGFNSQWQRLGGTPGWSLLTSDAVRGYDQDWRFGNFGDFSIAVVGKLTPYIETSLGVTSLVFGGVKRAANIFDLQNPGNVKDGQDWLILYGFQWTVKIDF
jgi:hypothetical protein